MLNKVVKLEFEPVLSTWLQCLYKYGAILFLEMKGI